MKRKLLSILALLLFVSGAWAQSTITVYATNTAGWSNTYIHYWGDSYNDWPGTAMELIYTDGLGHKFYKATIPNDVDGILFTNGATELTKQSVDITSDIADGAWWEVNSTTSAGKYGVEYKGLVPHGNCGTSGHESDVTWVLTEDNVLTITGTGAMANYSQYNQPWIDYRTHIEGIVINSGVTCIGTFAFYECDNESLTSITIPSTVTVINNYAFISCTSLASVTFSTGSQLQTINISAFQGCNSLTSIDIPSSVKNIGDHAFRDCSELGTITLNSNPNISSSAFSVIKDGATITMNLTVNKAAEGEYWTTFYNLNYNFQISDAGGQNTQIFKAALSDAKLTLTELKTDKIITKDKAVILKSNASPISLTLTTTDSGNDYDTDNSLSGVSSASGLTADGTHFVLNKGSQGVGFYRMTSGKVIGVGKAYLTYSGALAREFFGFDETTGIDEVSSFKFQDSGSDVYDLQGRRVTNPTKGLYIVNGKKVVIK